MDTTKYRRSQLQSIARKIRDDTHFPIRLTAPNVQLKSYINSYVPYTTIVGGATDKLPSIMFTMTRDKKMYIKDRNRTYKVYQGNKKKNSLQKIKGTDLYVYKMKRSRKEWVTKTPVNVTTEEYVHDIHTLVHAALAAKYTIVPSEFDLGTLELIETKQAPYSDQSGFICSILPTKTFHISVHTEPISDHTQNDMRLGCMVVNIFGREYFKTSKETDSSDCVTVEGTQLCYTNRPACQQKIGNTIISNDSKINEFKDLLRKKVISIDNEKYTVDFSEFMKLSATAVRDFDIYNMDLPKSLEPPTTRENNK